MKKVISFILAVICIVPVGSINASAEELTMGSKKDNGIKTVIGINTTNYITLGPDVDKNTGLRITTNILNAIYNNSHLSD